MSIYLYSELLAKATSKNATKKDRIELLMWLENYGGRDWNGEIYTVKVEKTLTVKPVYKEVDEDNYELVDVEIY